MAGKSSSGQKMDNAFFFDRQLKMDIKKRQKIKLGQIDRWINGQKREQGDRKRGPKASGEKKEGGLKLHISITL